MRLRTTQPVACRQSFAARSPAPAARAVVAARAIPSYAASPQALADTRRPLGEGLRLGGCCTVKVRTANAGSRRGKSGRPARTVTTMGLPIPVIGELSVGHA